MAGNPVATVGVMTPANNAGDYGFNVTPRTKPEERRLHASMSLAALAQERFRVAAQDRSAISQAMLECERAMAGKPISGHHIDPELPVVLNISAAIAEGLHAGLVDAINMAADNLFTLKSTPDPELTEEALTQIRDVLAQEQEAMMTLGLSGDQINFADTMDRVAALAEATRLQAQAVAEEAARDLQVVVRDKLQEGGFREAFSAALLDYVSSMAMVLKAPAGRYKLTRVWQGGRMTYRRSIVKGVERVKPEAFYLSPGAMDPHTAEWTLELRRVQPSELIELASDPDYDAQAITEVLKAHPQGWIEAQDGVTSCLDPNNGGLYSRSFAYDAVIMHGKIKGQILEDMGIKVGDVNNVYEAVVTSIGTFAISALINTDVTGKRPYHMRSFYTDRSTPWGGSPVSRLRDLQRVVSSLFIAMGGDAAMAGVYVEVDPNALHADETHHGKVTVRPREVRKVKANTGGNGMRQRAFDIHSVATQVAAFQNEIERLHALAYEITGIPRMSLGQTSGASTIGRTAGGVAAMLAMSTKGNRRALQDLEEHIIEPTAQAFVDWELMFNPPPEFRGDINVRARGLSGQVEQQESVDELSWALQTLGSVADKMGPSGQPLVPPNAFIYLIYRMFKAKGLPTDSRIFPQDFDKESALEGAGAPSLPVTGTTDQIMDLSRSPAAGAAIQASLDPTGVGPRGQ